MPKLTDQQKRFAETYVSNGFDMTAAAIKAGYSEKNASSIASRVIRRSQVKAFIDSLCEQVTEKASVDSAEVIRELRKIAFAPVSERINTGDRLRALELLGKYLCLFSDRSIISTETCEMPIIDCEQETRLRELAQTYVQKLTRPPIVEAKMLTETTTKAGRNNA